MSNLINDENYIEHHGILGMKWGIRRTPQQLGHKTTSTQSKIKKEREKRKQKEEDIQRRRTEILRDPKKLYKHRKEFSKEEIDEAMKKFESDESLRKMAYKDKRSASSTPSSSKTSVKKNRDTENPTKMSDFDDAEIARMAKRFENEQKIRKALEGERKSPPPSKLDKALKFVSSAAGTTMAVASTYYKIKDLEKQDKKGDKKDSKIPTPGDDNSKTKDTNKKASPPPTPSSSTKDTSKKTSPPPTSSKKKKSKARTATEKRNQGESFVNDMFSQFGNWHIDDNQFLLPG